MTPRQEKLLTEKVLRPMVKKILKENFNPTIPRQMVQIMRKYSISNQTAIDVTADIIAMLKDNDIIIS